MPDLQAVVFDLGGTLWHWPRKDPVRDAAFFWGRPYDHAGQNLPHSPNTARSGKQPFLNAMVATKTEYRRRTTVGGRSQTPQSVAAGGLRRLGIRSDGEEVSAVLDGFGRVAVGWAEPFWAEPFPDAAPTLSRLRGSGYRIGLLSNTWWSFRRLEEGLENLGLAGLFDEVLFTSTGPHTRPHPFVFPETTRRLDAEPAACMRVGDGPRREDAGRRHARGWKGNGRPDTRLGGVMPDAKVARLSELPALPRGGLF